MAKTWPLPLKNSIQSSLKTFLTWTFLFQVVSVRTRVKNTERIKQELKDYKLWNKMWQTTVVTLFALLNYLTCKNLWHLKNSNQWYLQRWHFNCLTSQKDKRVQKLNFHSIFLNILFWSIRTETWRHLKNPNKELITQVHIGFMKCFKLIDNKNEGGYNAYPWWRPGVY